MHSVHAICEAFHTARYGKTTKLVVNEPRCIWNPNFEFIMLVLRASLKIVVIDESLDDLKPIKTWGFIQQFRTFAVFFSV